ncbi:MAG: hypothetical protein AAGG75_09580 [Bacteroidota bacterium]
MSNLEIKGGILQMIASINDKESLLELKELISQFLGNHLKDTDYWDELSEPEKQASEQAIEESEDEANHISHHLVMKKYKKWLEK